MSIASFGQDRDTLNVVAYNLLKYPSSSPERISELKNIMAYLQPDILMVCELTSGAGANSILFDVLNEDGISSYDMADYISGPDTENQLYFNTDKLALSEQNVIETSLRDINEYVLYYKSIGIEDAIDTTFFYVYVCHLKAGIDFQEQRNGQVEELRNYIDERENIENVIIGGDFNFYGSVFESGWNTLLGTGEVSIKDPLVAAGEWHTNSDFAWLHTQSTRTESFDGGATGGMDDRFDFIFISEDLRTFENGADYISNSYRAVGQDGLRYNNSLIDSPTNLSEPSDIINSLYEMSDHLPIYLELEVLQEGVSIEEEKETIFQAYYNKSSDCITFKENGIIQEKTLLIYNLQGQLITTYYDNGTANCISTKTLKKGIYIAQLATTNFSLKFVK